MKRSQLSTKLYKDDAAVSSTRGLDEAEVKIQENFQGHEPG